MSMLHVNDEKVRTLLLEGNFGLEKESLRIMPNGHMAYTPNPFPGNKHIVRDFCENQTEINTPVLPSAKAAVDSLWDYTRQIQRTLAALPNRELLWPFSNPPLIQNEADIPVAQFTGERTGKTTYREYLSDRYGRYKMTLCGIHVNYSFSDELLQTDFALSGQSDFQEYKNQIYVTLAERMAAYGWIMTAVTAASPLMDSSYVEKGRYGIDTFNGMASTRCSELGYWNYFTPIFDYSNIRAYADSISQYVKDGLLVSPTELYYPIRLKPRGSNRLDTLREEGVDHIELRMVDLNPLQPSGIERKDLQFAQLLLVYLAGTPRQSFTLKDQVQAVQNFKNAAHYDLKTVKIVVPNKEVYSVADAGRKVIGFMREFYQDFPGEIQEVLDFEDAKFEDPENRYAWKIRRQYAEGFLSKGLQLAEQRQQEAL
ncbi:MAG: hypothetical protein MR332_13905 [Fusicatenibacter sp.]|nr:hypothetical protein [Fusicatenibacter sp.]